MYLVLNNYEDKEDKLLHIYILLVFNNKKLIHIYLKAIFLYLYLY